LYEKYKCSEVLGICYRVQEILTGHTAIRYMTLAFDLDFETNRLKSD